MPSFQPPIMSSNFDEEQWVIYITQALDEDDEELETENPVHIFNVPPILMAIDPFSFVPQQVSIGPYHFSRPELNELELYKLAAAKRNQREVVDQDFKIQTLVESLINFEPIIRASYHKVLNFRRKTLAWMMAVDASFLLEFLQVCSVSKPGKETSDISSRRLSHLVNLSQNITNSVILRDIIMLENQIPLFVLRKLLELQLSSVEKADDMIRLMLFWLCEELSPFKISKDLAKKFQAKNYSHLLDVLYYFVVPKMEGFSEITESEEEMFHVNEERECLGEISGNKKFIFSVWKKGPEVLIKKIKFLNPLKKIVRLPFSILSNVPLLKDSILQKFLNSQDKENNERETPTSDNGIISKPPLLEEIEIPSVTDLAKAGVCFKPTSKGIQSISFDVKTATFFLPTISLDVNSQVVLRNLVAYEACNAKGPLVLTRYTELLNGIIDAEEDARLLRERGIVINRLKSDKEVTNLCNGMCKSIRLTKVPALDKVIEDVNKFYNGTWRVKFERHVKKYVFESWRLLTFLACILMIGFMGLQAFCSVYNCSHSIFVEQLH